MHTRSNRQTHTWPNKRTDVRTDGWIGTTTDGQTDTISFFFLSFCFSPHAATGPKNGIAKKMKTFQQGKKSFSCCSRSSRAISSARSCSCCWLPICGLFATDDQQPASFLWIFFPPPSSFFLLWAFFLSLSFFSRPISQQHKHTDWQTLWWSSSHFLPFLAPRFYLVQFWCSAQRTLCWRQKLDFKLEKFFFSSCCSVCFI